MSKEFKLPDLGEGIHEAQVVNVMISQGDTVTEDQMVMEVETDKASVELPVPYAGKVTSLNVKQGDTVKVGQVLLVVGGDGAAAAKAEAPAVASAPKTVSAPAAAVASRSAAAPPPPVSPTAVAEAPSHHDGGPIPAAPAVRRLARESGVDLRDVHGTGSGGRILKEDVERFVITGSSGRAAAPSAPAAAPSSAGYAAAPSAPMPPVGGGDALPDFSQWGPVRREAVPQIRKAISRQMVKAWTLPRVTHGDEADVTDLEAFRKEHGKVMAEQGAKLTITTFIVKAVAGALRQFPVFNSSFDEAAGEIIYKDYVHIGMAVDTDRGLMVPVLRDADRKGLMTISKEMKEISEKAREFKLPIEGMRGGTFTVTNVGSLGGTFSTPMINYPEVAILGMGKMQEKPVVKNGQIVVRKMMPLFLSFDHRVVDGADGARFTRMIIDFLENPLNLLLAS
ncbi:MAG: 2-oxo acid dehydrogenase subunit E2 [Phycisphaerales bacterium]|nr:2-oxo acid dehydrogenase subunit E2 [Phycisphaerales bacterium]MCB9857371.1 2-oxo acid dehydrogenase subunit E2 [Phycisphaerales bacterium]